MFRHIVITDRYLIREISLPFVAITLGLIALFASYSATVYLADAASGQLPTDIVLKLIGLKVLIALEVLLPLGFYLGIIFGLGRLYTDQEMTALQAGGLSRAAMMRPLLWITLLMAIIAGLLAIFGRPWAYSQVYALEISAQQQIDITQLDTGRFQSTGDGKFVLYAQDVVKHPKALQDAADTESDSRIGNTLGNIFVALDDPSGQGSDRIIIRAQRLTQIPQKDAPPTLKFHEGRLYRLDRNGAGDEILHFGTFTWVARASDRVVGYKRKAASSRSLLSATDTDDIAERQWRFSRPLATVFLGILGMAFARSSPRRGRSVNSFAAAVGFALYYNLAGIARTWVEQGDVPLVPGIYWVDALIGALALVLLFRPGIRFY